MARREVRTQRGLQQAHREGRGGPAQAQLRLRDRGLSSQLLEIDADLGQARAGLRQALKKRHEAKKGQQATPARHRWGHAVGHGQDPAQVRASTTRLCQGARELPRQQPASTSKATRCSACPWKTPGTTSPRWRCTSSWPQIAPKNAEALKRAGAMMYRTGEHAKALEYYERALQADPRDQEALKARKDLAAETALTGGGYENVKPTAASASSTRTKRACAGAFQAHVHERGRPARRARAGRGALRRRAPATRIVMLELAGLHERLKDLRGRARPGRAGALLPQDLLRVGGPRRRPARQDPEEGHRPGGQGRATRSRLRELEGELAEAEVADYARRVELAPGRCLAEGPVRSNA